MARVLRVAIPVIEYQRRLAPEPRKAIKAALVELRSEKGDIASLEANLAGYHRLRVGRHRIIFSYASDGAIDVIFIEERRLVYELFESEFIKRLKA